MSAVPQDFIIYVLQLHYSLQESVPINCVTWAPAILISNRVPPFWLVPSAPCSVVTSIITPIKFCFGVLSVLTQHERVKELFLRAPIKLLPAVHDSLSLARTSAPPPVVPSAPRSLMTASLIQLGVSLGGGLPLLPKHVGDVIMLLLITALNQSPDGRAASTTERAASNSTTTVTSALSITVTALVIRVEHLFGVRPWLPNCGCPISAPECAALSPDPLSQAPYIGVLLALQIQHSKANLFTKCVSQVSLPDEHAALITERVFLASAALASELSTLTLLVPLTMRVVMVNPPPPKTFYGSVLSQDNESIFTTKQSTSSVLIPEDDDYAAPRYRDRHPNHGEHDGEPHNTHCAIVKSTEGSYPVGDEAASGDQIGGDRRGHLGDGHGVGHISAGGG
jgi:hypothetical protein